MLTAYYSRGYDVIHIDIQWFLSNVNELDHIVKYITDAVLAELREYYPEVITMGVVTLPDALSRIKNVTGQKFIVIIDEAANVRVQNEYIGFLQGMFKGTEPTKYIQLAYLTGILPIKKEKTQSVLNNFDEFTMLEASNLAPYIGFTEDEVKDLCETYQKDFEKVNSEVTGRRQALMKQLFH